MYLHQHGDLSPLEKRHAVSESDKLRASDSEIGKVENTLRNDGKYGGRHPYSFVGLVGDGQRSIHQLPDPRPRMRPIGPGSLNDILVSRHLL